MLSHFRKLTILLGCFLAFSTHAAFNPTAPKNIQLERSRIVIDNGQNEGSFGIKNNLDTAVLINSWVEDFRGQKIKTFLTSPPVFRLMPQKEARIRITQTKTLPQDRESVFYIAVQGLPASTEKYQNTMHIVLQQRFKLFYRPKGIPEDSHDAADALQWSYSNGKLSVKNPSKVSVSLAHILFEKNNLDIKVTVLPYEEAHWTLKRRPTKLDGFSFVFIDEYGGTIRKQVKLHKN